LIPPQEILRTLSASSLSANAELTGAARKLQNSREVRELRHLFQCWHDVLKRVREATQVLLFFDYDGTLTPIAARPEMAALSSQAREVLRQISHNDMFKLAVISGRSLDDIKMLTGLENITYAGNHGLEIECPLRYCQERGSETTTFIHPIAKQFKPSMQSLEQKLKEELAGIDGVLVENKGLTLSIHYRLVRRTAARTIEKLVLEAIQNGEMRGKLLVTQGKKVFEVRPPVEWNKGKAVEWLMEISGTPGGLPIFAGDDITDEDAFRVLHDIGGISIFVGEATASNTADYCLDSPEQLYRWLEKLLEETQ
jgi:trehalose 6-phosphate phosphatase